MDRNMQHIVLAAFLFSCKCYVLSSNGLIVPVEFANTTLAYFCLLTCLPFVAWHEKSWQNEWVCAFFSFVLSLLLWKERAALPRPLSNVAGGGCMSFFVFKWPGVIDAGFLLWKYSRLLICNVILFRKQIMVYSFYSATRPLSRQQASPWGAGRALRIVTAPLHQYLVHCAKTTFQCYLR